MRLLAALACAALLAILAGCGGDAAGGGSAASGAGSTPVAAADRGAPVLPAAVQLLNGRRLPTSQLAGKVVLVVNTASRCGFTPQFDALESLYRGREADGFVIVGFPSNDFRQELTSAGAIARFCKLNYGVSFPMAAKGHVTGRHAQPLFAAIAARPRPAGAPPDWNFTKYLLDRDGRLVERFPSSVTPDDPALTSTLDALLAEGRG